MSSLEDFGKPEDKKVKTLEDFLPKRKPKPTEEEREIGRAQYKELLTQGKGLEAVKYADLKGVLESDEDIFEGMKVITKAMDNVVKQQDDLQAEWDKAKMDGGLSEVEKKLKGDEIENKFNILQEKYDSLDRDYEEISKWRKTGEW